MSKYQLALKHQEGILFEYPDNVEALRYAVQLLKEMGQSFEHYMKKLSELQQENAQQDDGGNNEQEEEEQYNNNNYQSNGNDMAHEMNDANGRHMSSNKKGKDEDEDFDDDLGDEMLPM